MKWPKNRRNAESSSEAQKQGYTNFYKKNHPGDSLVYCEEKLKEINICDKNKVQRTRTQSEKKIKTLIKIGETVSMPFACGESLLILGETRQVQTGNVSFKVYNVQTTVVNGSYTVLPANSFCLYSRETQLGGGSILLTCQNLLAPRTFRIIPLPKKREISL